MKKSEAHVRIANWILFNPGYDDGVKSTSVKDGDSIHFSWRFSIDRISGFNKTYSRIINKRLQNTYDIS